MPGISIQVTDVSRGVPATGMRVELYKHEGRRTHLSSGVVDAAGSVPLPAFMATQPQPVGTYEAVFHVEEFYRKRGDALPTPAFLTVAPFVFGIAEPSQHYHLPVKLTPWGLSVFRAGA
jgi:5-hydroxyisourate hydrolase